MAAVAAVTLRLSLSALFILSLLCLHSQRLIHCALSLFYTTKAQIRVFNLGTRLGNPEVRRVVDQSIQEYLTEYLEYLDSILSKALNAFKYSLFGSILTIGAMIGAIISGRIADYAGRRVAMGFSKVFCIFGWLAITFSKVYH
ncbi:hypothetical protein RIF29_20838 [Crotalaria pallida]|uniref:Major facilitator superfamily (MFS) profile domain-containing protein n=1 Tax=Crotalaria pallida TaxID=3830 RepID=A0AAN9ICU2_CROPI